MKTEHKTTQVASSREWPELSDLSTWRNAGAIIAKAVDGGREYGAPDSPAAKATKESNLAL